MKKEERKDADWLELCEWLELNIFNYDIDNGINNGRLGFKSDGTAYVGDVGDEQPLLTRDMAEKLTDGQVLVWDKNKLRAVGSSAFVKKTEYASSSNAGVIKMGNVSTGLRVVNGIIYVYPATNTEIDSRTTDRPITPKNLDYAVKSVVGSHITLTQEEYDYLVESDSVNQNAFYYIVEE